MKYSFDHPPCPLPGRKGVEIISGGYPHPSEEGLPKGLRPSGHPIFQRAFREG